MPRPLLLALVLLAACSDSDTTSSTTADTTEAPATTEAPPVTTGESPTTTTGALPGCPVTHPRVGWRAELATFQHKVSGTAEILDDCTIQVTEFNYDGTGLDVRFYGGIGGNFAAGFALSDDLLRAGGYTDETMTLTLPDGVTLSDLDGLSVWCVDVGVDFGSGTFAAP